MTRRLGLALVASAVAAATAPFIAPHAVDEHFGNLLNATRSRAGGTMLHDASTNIRVLADFPWLLSPAAAMFLVVLGLNLVLQEGRPKGLHYKRLL